MKTNSRWSRRAFLQGAGCVSSLGILKGLGVAQQRQPKSMPAGFAYIGSVADSKIHVFQMKGSRWDLRQTIDSQAPSFLAIHPNRQFLYAVNEVAEYRGLPRGTIEAYKIDAADGSLSIINRQSLSLSGTEPRHLAISPDGATMVVAIYGGGAYNVLPIAVDGSVGRPVDILKEVGSGRHPEYQRSAHPHSVLFDESGKYAFSTDQGCNRLNVFALQDGRLVRKHQMQTGAGPGHMAMHGSKLYMLNALHGSITTYFLSSSAKVTASDSYNAKAPSITPGREWSRGSLVVSPSGNFLYSAHTDGLAAWKIDPASGLVSHARTWDDASFQSLRSLMAVPSPQGLIALDHDHDRAIFMEIDAGSGEPGEIMTLADVAKPASLVMKYI